MGNTPIGIAVQDAGSRIAIIEAIAKSAEQLLTESLADCGPTVLRMIGEAAAAETAAIWMDGPDGVRRLAHDWSRHTPPRRSPADGARIADVQGTSAALLAGEAVLVRPESLQPSLRDYFAEIGIGSIARVSIVIDGRNWGELNVGYRSGDEPNDSELDSLRTAASCIAGAVALAAVKGSLARRDAILGGVAAIAELLIQGRPIDETMPEALEVLAGATGASRVVMWEHLGEVNGGAQARRRWAFTGGKRGRPDDEVVQVDPEFFESIRRNEINAVNGDALKARRWNLQQIAGVAQVLIIPVFAGERLWGGLAQSFADASNRSPGELDAVRAAASIFGSALQAAETASALHLTEERLRQSEKLEAIGRLAGGVAHDFNNLLTAILGYADLLSDETGSEEARQIVSAATRAAGLTRQLLAFSRRQAVHDDVVDLAGVVREVAGLIERVIGEDIVVSTTIDPELGMVVADSTQIHQVLLNLALNGRDAMPRGGHLRIRAANVDAAPPWTVSTVGDGPLVCLSVEDEGVGMDDDTRDRALEPFFTTKAPGVGTGLGLSTVHGIVRASGGDITFDSKVGEGTVVRVWLPRVAAVLPDLDGDSVVPVRLDVGGLALVALVVEDDEVVRMFARTTLERAGMRVVVAADPISALRRAREETRIDVLVADVVMPVMNGHELAARFTRIYPEAALLLISGYPSAEVLPGPDTRIGFLAKPFAAEALVGAVRASLSLAVSG